MKTAVLFSIAIFLSASCFETTAQAETPDTCSVIKNTLHETRKYSIDDTVNSIHAMWIFEAALRSLPRDLGKAIFNNVIKKNGGEQYDEISTQDRAKGYQEAFEEILETSCKESGRDPAEKFLAPPTNLRAM